MRKNISRKEVAEAVGVSGAMVSYALSSSSKVKIKQETRERICRIANEMGYIPNFMGNALAQGRSYNVGLLFPENLRDSISVHYLLIMHGLSKAVNDEDYTLSIFFGANGKLDRKVREGRLDGIFYADNRIDDTLLNKLLEYPLPLVVINKDIDVNRRKNLACSRGDHEKFMTDAVTYFHEKGARRILHFNELDSNSPKWLMYQAFNRACEAYAEQGVIGTILPTSQVASTNFANIFRNGFAWDGVLVNDPKDTNAFIAASRHHGLEPGKDFAFVSYSSDATIQHLSKGYNQNSTGMGEMAWPLMKSMLNGEIPDNKKILIPYIET